MKHGSVGTLLLGVGLAVVPAHSLAAEPGETGLQPGEMGYVIARGSFDPAPLCANAGVTCSVVENRIALAEDVAIGKLHGAAVVSIAYRANPDCGPTTSTTWVEFTGEGSTATEALGSLVGENDIDWELLVDDICHPGTMEYQTAGVWGAKPLGGDKLRGEIFWPDSSQEVNAYDFTLDVTWQADAPDGFFGQDGSSDTGAFFFFIDALMPGE